jgi:hypothetical protein
MENDLLNIWMCSLLILSAPLFPNQAQNKSSTCERHCKPRPGGCKFAQYEEENSPKYRDDVTIRMHIYILVSSVCQA